MPDELTGQESASVDEPTPVSESADAIDTEPVSFSVTEPATTFAVTREARLFEAGDFPDKGISITEGDLDNIIAATGDVPIRIEHTDTPFDGVLGTCGKLLRRGKELFGSLSLTDAAWGLLQQTKHRGLSVGILPDKSALAEVSLTLTPRIASAQMFSEGVVGFSADVPWTYEDEGNTRPKEVNTMPDEITTTVAEDIQTVKEFSLNNPDAKAVFNMAKESIEYRKGLEEELRIAAAEARAATMELQKDNCERLIEKFKREGKITPAAEADARAILAEKPLGGRNSRHEAAVHCFSKDGAEEIVHYAVAFERFLEKLSPVISFQEITRQAEAEAAVPVAALDIFSKLGVDPKSDIAKGVLAEMRR